jgi:hypothetical protein
MKDSNWYVVDDLDNFILSTRKLLFNHFGKKQDDAPLFDSMLSDIKPEEQGEFDTILTQEESLLIAKNILKKQHHKQTKQIRYLVSDETYMKLVEDMNDRMVSNILNNLVNKGYLESGYDIESNDFIFWIKDAENQEEKEKPETD